MKRFEEINGPKFERLSHAEMESVKGGRVCIACMKRSKGFKVGVKGNNWYFGPNRAPRITKTNTGICN